MIFFKPRSSFLNWLKSYAGGRIVFDVGSGEGYLLKEMNRAGIKCIGIEPLWGNYYEIDFSLANQVLQMEAQSCNLLHKVKDALILFCRPCHSGFVRETIPLINNSNEIFYISRPDNIMVDLPGIKTKVLRAVGLKEEKLYKVIL